jgi:hypothetical protein
MFRGLSQRLSLARCGNAGSFAGRPRWRPQRREAMQLAIEQRAEGLRVQGQVILPLHKLEAGGAKQLGPLLPRLIVVNQAHAVPAIPHPVHETQSHVRGQAFAYMILEDNAGARYARGFSQQGSWIRIVVQNINERDPINGFVGHRDVASVEHPYGDMCLGSLQDVQPGDLDARYTIHDGARDRAIAASHVENSIVRLELCRNQIGENAYPPLEDGIVVHRVEESAAKTQVGPTSRQR